MLGYERAMKPKTPRKSTFTPVVMYPLTPWPVEYIGTVGQVGIYLHLLLSDKLTLLHTIREQIMPTTEACPPLCIKVFRRPRSHHDVKPYTAPKVLYPRYVGKQRQKIPPPLFFSFNPVEKTYFELLRCGIQFIKSLFYRCIIHNYQFQLCLESRPLWKNGY